MRIIETKLGRIGISLSTKEINDREAAKEVMRRQVRDRIALRVKKIKEGKSIVKIGLSLIAKEKKEKEAVKQATNVGKFAYVPQSVESVKSLENWQLGED